MSLLLVARFTADQVEHTTAIVKRTVSVDPLRARSKANLKKHRTGSTKATKQLFGDIFGVPNYRNQKQSENKNMFYNSAGTQSQRSHLNPLACVSTFPSSF